MPRPSSRTSTEGFGISEVECSIADRWASENCGLLIIASETKDLEAWLEAWIDWNLILDCFLVLLSGGLKLQGVGSHLGVRVVHGCVVKTFATICPSA